MASQCVAFALACVVSGASAFAQPHASERPVAPPSHRRVTIPGTAFSVEGSRSSKGTRVDDVHDGRRFRGPAFSKVNLVTKVELPKSDRKMVGLAVHFRTSQLGPSLRAVELSEGRYVRFRIPTLLRGDYRSKEITRPEAAANAWLWDNSTLLPPLLTLRLEVQFPGGFDSEIDPGEFVLIDVVITPRQ